MNRRSKRTPVPRTVPDLPTLLTNTNSDIQRARTSKGKGKRRLLDNDDDNQEDKFLSTSAPSRSNSLTRPREETIRNSNEEDGNNERISGNPDQEKESGKRRRKRKKKRDPSVEIIMIIPSIKSSQNTSKSRTEKRNSSSSTTKEELLNQIPRPSGRPKPRPSVTNNISDETVPSSPSTEVPNASTQGWMSTPNVGSSSISVSNSVPAASQSFTNKVLSRPPQFTSPTRPKPRPSVTPSSFESSSPIKSSQRPKPRPSVSAIDTETDSLPIQPIVESSNASTRNSNYNDEVNVISNFPSISDRILSEPRIITEPVQNDGGEQPHLPESTSSVSARQNKQSNSVTKAKSTIRDASWTRSSDSSLSRALRSSRKVSPVVIIIEDTPSLSSTPQRSPGRSRSNSPPSEPVVRKRGRPRKQIEVQEPFEESVKLKRGRPRKQIDTEMPSKRAKTSKNLSKQNKESSSTAANSNGGSSASLTQPISQPTRSASEDIQGEESRPFFSQVIKPPKRKQRRRSLTPEPEPEPEEEEEEENNGDNVFRTLSGSSLSRQMSSSSGNIFNTQQSFPKPSQSQRPKARAAVDDEDWNPTEDSLAFQTAPNGMESLKRQMEEDVSDEDEESEDQEHMEVDQSRLFITEPGAIEQEDENTTNHTHEKASSPSPLAVEVWRTSMDQVMEVLQGNFDRICQLCSINDDNDVDISNQTIGDIEEQLNVLVRSSDEILTKIGRLGRDASDENQSYAEEKLTFALERIREMKEMVKQLHFRKTKRPAEASSDYESAVEDQEEEEEEEVGEQPNSQHKATSKKEAEVAKQSDSSQNGLFIKQSANAHQIKLPLNILVPMSIDNRDELLHLIRSNGGQSCNKIEKCDLIIVDDDFDVILANKTTLNIVQIGLKQKVPKTILRKSWLEESIRQSRILDQTDEKFIIRAEQLQLFQDLPKSRLHVTIPEIDLEQLIVNRVQKPVGKGGNVRIAFTESDSKNIVEHLAITRECWNGVLCAKELEFRFGRHPWMAYQTHLRDNLNKNKNYSERIMKYKRLMGEEKLNKQQGLMLKEIALNEKTTTNKQEQPQEPQEEVINPILPIFS